MGDTDDAATRFKIRLAPLGIKRQKFTLIDDPNNKGRYVFTVGFHRCHLFIVLSNCRPEKKLSGPDQRGSNSYDRLHNTQWRAVLQFLALKEWRINFARTCSKFAGVVHEVLPGSPFYLKQLAIQTAGAEWEPALYYSRTFNNVLEGHIRVIANERGRKNPFYTPHGFYMFKSELGHLFTRVSSTCEQFTRIYKPVDLGHGHWDHICAKCERWCVGQGYDRRFWNCSVGRGPWVNTFSMHFFDLHTRATNRTEVYLCDWCSAEEESDSFHLKGEQCRLYEFVRMNS